MQPPTGRLYVCARCRAQVIVCRRCDSGQTYCDRDCAQAARRASLREAGRRYQRSRRGRMAHAARMRRYRQRREKVTHHSSAEPTADALLITTSTTSASQTSATMATTPSLGHCRFCSCACEFVRHGPLRRRVFHEVRTATEQKGTDP